MRIAIIGAGPAGLTAAYELSKGLKSGSVEHIDLFEISSQVGGLSKSFELWGQTVDLGPHRFFSHDRRINELWLEVVEGEFDIVSRQTRIFYKNKFYDYPLKALNALKNLGIFEAILCVLSYIIQQIFPKKNPNTFESWVISRFGKRLYKHFFKSYSEKLWGIKCDQLDSDFASQRIKKLSLFEAVKNSIFTSKKNSHKTLVDEFAYPLKGTGFVYEKMADTFQKNGGKLHLSKGIEKVITSGRKVTGLELTSGEYLEYDHIISSMPISLLVNRLPETPFEIKELANSLKFRNTILVYLRINKTNLFPDQWLYIHSDELKTGRITNFRNWIPELYGDDDHTIICMEYWYNFEDEEWSMSDESFIDIAKQEFSNTGLLKDGDIIDGKVIRLPRCYPVYFKDYKNKLKPIENYLNTIENLQAIGRYGSYKYNNQDHSIYMGILAAENILKNEKHNLWEINTDYEAYQEETIITKTGLVKNDKLTIMNKSFLNTLSKDHKLIADKILNKVRISEEEAIVLFKEFDLAVLGILANVVRERLNENFTYFNRNIHIEPTNICIHNCLFCSYSRKINQEGAWEYSLEEIRNLANSYKDSGITEVHIVGGVHPNRTADYYAELIQTVKNELPDVHIKAFTAVEIEHMAKKAKMDVRTALQKLKAAGLDSIPGGGAEIFDEELRKKICPDKTNSEKWLDVHRQAHKLGIPSNCTILYGHIESYEQRIDHLSRLRLLQDETNGFNAFIPLKYRSSNNEMSYSGEVSTTEDLRNYAVSRIFLDNIPHIKAYWPMIGKDVSVISLSFGVDDLDGTIQDTTKIYTMAGSEEQNPEMSIDEISTLIKSVGRIAVERNSIYEAINIFK